MEQYHNTTFLVHGPHRLMQLYLCTNVRQCTTIIRSWYPIHRTLLQASPHLEVKKVGQEAFVTSFFIMYNFQQMLLKVPFEYFFNFCTWTYTLLDQVFCDASSLSILRAVKTCLCKSPTLCGQGIALPRWACQNITLTGLSQPRDSAHSTVVEEEKRLLRYPPSFFIC